jgi:hypothetical protein
MVISNIGGGDMTCFNEHISTFFQRIHFLGPGQRGLRRGVQMVRTIRGVSPR